MTHFENERAVEYGAVIGNDGSVGLQWMALMACSRHWNDYRGA
jgi:hypothetical protein